MLKCSSSLWSANLGQLTHEIHRVQPHTDRFHLDVADGRYIQALLFSPDMVRALRPATKLPLEVHLMVTDPLAWIAPFADAGADDIIFDLETTLNPGEVIEAIHSRGKKAGIALNLNHKVQEIESFAKDLDILAITGVAPGAREGAFGPAAVEKIHLARELIFQHRWKMALEAEGGIDRETVPVLKAAGVDYIVLGSPFFEGNPKKVREWLS